MKTKILTLIFFCTLALNTRGQNVSKEALDAWLIMPTLGFYGSGGELGDRIKRGLDVGLKVEYKTSGNWHFGLGGQYLYSNSVRDEDAVIAPMLTEGGEVFNPTGTYARVAIDLRGVSAMANLGKTTPILAVNPNSGVDLQISGGYLAYWYNISSGNQNVPQIQDEYEKGYDQLSMGVILRQSIGYQYLSPKKTINLRLSFEVSEIWAENVRGYNYASGEKTSGREPSLLYGLRLSWILPIYGSGAGRDEYYYD